MGTDSCLVDCPKPKKSRPSVENVNSNWCCLPTVILHEIFLLLDQHDRIAASSVCKNWRQILYHSVWWKSVTFRIQENELLKARYLISSFGNIVSNATVIFDSMSPECTEEFITLVYYLSQNENLKSFIIEPRCCRIEFSADKEESDMRHLINYVKKCCRHSLKRFSYGGIEELSKHMPDFLEIMGSNALDVTHLGMASVKDDPGNYKIMQVDLKLFTPFRKLQVLSVDYDIVSDEFLKTLDGLMELHRLIVHVHGVDDNHVGTTESAWKHFNTQHKKCELRLSLIHAYKEVHFLEDILKHNMPLSHLKVFFCELMNVNVLHYIPMWYSETFRSLMWIDSQYYDESNSSYVFIGPGAGLETAAPDPLVMIAWQCRKLEEIVLMGYKYYIKDLLAIARLRNNSLKVLEVADADVVYSQDDTETYKSEVAGILRKPWAPLPLEELHPVLCDSTAGDSDEYLLPRVLADLHAAVLRVFN